MPVTEVNETNTAESVERRRRRKVGAAEPAPRQQASVPTAAPRESDLEPAPMRRRLAARLVDIIAVFTWMFALSIAHVFIHLQRWSETVAPEPWGTWFLATITFTVFYAIYEIAFITRTGSTPGKDLMGIRVVDQTTGAKPTLGQATRRWFLPGIVQPIPGAWISGVLTMVWGATAFTDSQHRTIHDRMAGTRVVTKEPPRDDAEREHRRRQFTPRFVDPFSVFRLARSNPEALRRHPEDAAL